jgi:RNA polymerase sigma-70 factor (ECF subfamily)
MSGLRDIVLTDLERAGAFDDAERTFQMTEDEFRLFYEQTARPVWIYLARMTGDDRLADDLLQDTYYRFLRTRTAFESDDHRRHYLFRIATNLVHDHRRRPRRESGTLDESAPHDFTSAPIDVGERAVRRLDLARAMDKLKPRDRSMLWLAYAQGFSHEEIAGMLGLRTSSLKALLHRARQRLIALLRVRPGDRS